MVLALISILLLGSARPPGSSASVCPPDDPRMRELVQRFQSRPAFAQDRASLGTGSVSPDQIRALSNLLDSAPCKRFAGIFGESGADPRWRWSAYRVGAYYFVAFGYTDPAGRQRLGYSPLFVYDADYNQVGAFAM
jgi:hypothetical protein